ncbi:putative serine-rich protein [Penicillium digitatum]|uniref:Putative serine-rich protein n=3 Tax=Penicillium digitatum TaxID=36651 RepID=K9G157_PEND2|nr:putative serine-rich protein [Penicillium digitatum Pd1]EKV07319.1 putative serine-rich protein [Penicillium digitatum Pd1]EKV08613.1 putative serine-rich protein [Penicillium digitatum PHI26]KAG0159332.1 hypothetical protein PDIDSM_6854 [Penicillium digitatum]QQK41179.1 putative serine-rich protein [Penicillium digitatum]
MTKLMRQRITFQTRFSIRALSTSRTQTPRTSLYRGYATKSSNDPEQATTTHQPDLPNRPIPSNKAKPTLSKGEQSPLTDREGNPKKDLPEDVKKHNQEMEERYDKPYNSTGDDGTVKPAFKS